MSDNLVTVAEFGSPVEAHMIKTLLEENGIECFIENENVALWFAPIGTGEFSVKLQVRETDEARALEIIKNPKQVNNTETDTVK